jgi:hypothetical protein
MTNEQKEQLHKARETAIQIRDGLMEKRAEIEKELAQQNKAIAALSGLLGEKQELDVGLTDAVLLILRTTRKALTATEIRNELREMGYDIDSFSNPMASLHQVLIRLDDKKAIHVSLNRDEKKTYTNITEQPPINIARPGTTVRGLDLGGDKKK